MENERKLFQSTTKIVSTSFKQATHDKQAGTYFPKEEGMFKFTCIEQAPGLSIQFFIIP